jgi:hypothetical protein
LDNPAYAAASIVVYSLFVAPASASPCLGSVDTAEDYYGYFARRKEIESLMHAVLSEDLLSKDVMYMKTCCGKLHQVYATSVAAPS